MEKLIECVPNFSEGKDLHLIKQITDEIEKTDGVRLLNVDPGKTTNRTVVTFVGTPEAVCEAAFQAIRKAAELIDMRKQHGEHPRMGATDVCPLIPVSNISMEETAIWSKKLAERVGKELNIPVYLYENSQPNPLRKNLSLIRSGEYEGFFKKITQPQWKPDFGPSVFPAATGATVIGARGFLVAYNINLNTTSVRRANAIAFDVRETGRVKREGHPVTGKPITDSKGEPVYIPGTLKSVKAIGWYIEEFGIAQISMNLTDISVTPVHAAFEEVSKKAMERGIRVTGSELVGLIPLDALLQAGRYFLHMQKRSLGISEKELIKIAVKSLGLEELGPFKPDERIIEYLLADKSSSKLAKLSLKEFSEETASESSAPGGGSVSAYLGSLGAALGTMVANLSAHKPGWDEHWEEFSKWAEKGMVLQTRLLALVDEDCSSFNNIMAAFSLPKSTAEEKNRRTQEIQRATKTATEVPLQVMELSLKSMELIQAMVEKGNPNSVSDAGVAALCARSAVMGAYLNVTINAKGLQDKTLAQQLISKGKALQEKAGALETSVLSAVSAKINGN